MSNRTLSTYKEPISNGIEWTLSVQRLASGRPGLIFVIGSDRDGDYDETCVIVEDGAAFLAPVNAWLKGE